ncbi:DUF2812 domain-containing protein [Viridibacillus sp. YIM B01967]|uniref:DUF2812 domain-containing protein n=1 Tax=Viridibacillus soli TaxID=2798301 RepID=A0ABS1H5E6_9BACL|nr:DUF2812 domain-containing protein [Viridibacillus soli]MBK3494647.1 DUF2812 domain-containing protein [Viridibacillus soli]
MTINKWRPLWSYRIDETEQWLAEMAQGGLQLTNIQRFSRVFQFEKELPAETTYQIQYDKSAQLPKTLQNNGWQEVVKAKRWQIVKNEQSSVSLFPSRDGVIKRNRFHMYIWSIFAFIGTWQLLMLFALLITSFFIAGERQTTPFWWMGPLVIVLFNTSVISLTIFQYRQVKRLENKYFKTSVDQVKVVGRTFKKWKRTWTYFPKMTEQWLMNMAEQGNRLVKVKGFFFTFEEGPKERASYVCELRWRVAPSYFEMHKEAGWQLKFKSSGGFWTCIIWARSYEEGEKVPRLSYDAVEEKRQSFRAYLMNSTVFILLLALISMNLWLNITKYEIDGGAVQKTMILIFTLSGLVFAWLLIKITYTYFIKERKLY